MILLFSSSGILPVYAEETKKNPFLRDKVQMFNHFPVSERFHSKGIFHDFVLRKSGVNEEKNTIVPRASVEGPREFQVFTLRVEEEHKDFLRGKSAEGEGKMDNLLLISLPITVSSFFFDEKVRSLVRGGRYSSGFDKYLFKVEHLGDARYGLAICGSLYVTGKICERHELVETAFMGIESMAAAGAISSLMKLGFGRLRPYKGKGPFVFKGPYSKSYKSSFPSGHTTIAFSLASVIAEQSESTFVDILSYALASSVAFQRMYDDKHWFSDVFFGAILGIYVGKKIVAMHRKKERNMDTIVIFDPVSEKVRLGVKIKF